MNKIAERLVTEGKPLSKACLEPTEILHSCESAFKEQQVQRLHRSRVVMDGYWIQYSMKSQKEDSEFYFWMKHLKILSREKLWQAAIAEMKLLPWSVSGLHIRRTLGREQESHVLTTERSAVNLSRNFSYSLTIQTAAGTSLQPISMKSTEVPISACSRPISEAETPRCVSQPEASFARVDSAQSIKNSGPTLPRRSSRRLIRATSREARPHAFPSHLRSLEWSLSGKLSTATISTEIEGSGSSDEAGSKGTFGRRPGPLSVNDVDATLEHKQPTRKHHLAKTTLNRRTQFIQVKLRSSNFN